MFLKIHSASINEKSFWSFIRTHEYVLNIYLVPNTFINKEHDRFNDDYAKIQINIYEIQKYLVRKIALKTFKSNVDLTLPMDGKYYAYKKLTCDCTFIINIGDEFFILNKRVRDIIQIIVNSSELKGSILVQLSEGNNRMKIVNEEEMIYQVDDVSYKVLNDYATVSSHYKYLQNFKFYFSVDPCYFLSHDLLLTTNFDLTLNDLKYKEIMIKGKIGTKSVYINRNNIIKTTLGNLPSGILGIIDCSIAIPNIFLNITSYEDILKHINKQLYVVYANEVGIDQGSLMKDYITTLGNKLMEDRRIQYAKNGFIYFVWKECNCIEINQNCKICKREVNEVIEYYNDTDDMPSILFYALLGYYIIIALKTNCTIPMRIAYAVYSIMLGHPVYLRSVQDEKIMHTIRYEQGDWLDDFTGILKVLNITDETPELKECAFLYSEYYLKNHKGYNILYMLFQMFILEKQYEQIFTDMKNSFFSFSKLNFKKLDLHSEFVYRGCCTHHSHILFNDSVNALEISPLQIFFILTGAYELSFQNIKQLFTFKNFTGSEFLINWFFEIIYDFYKNNRKVFRDFIKFATGSETLTYTDLYIYKIKITIIRSVGINQYLRSASCSSTIVLSFYNSKEKMREKIVDSLIEGRGFLIA